MDAVPVRKMPRDRTCIGTMRGEICLDMVERRKDMLMRYCYCYGKPLGINSVCTTYDHHEGHSLVGTGK